MSNRTTNPGRSAHRAQIVAEAVVSAYIQEISPTERRRRRAPARQECHESPSSTARSSWGARTRRRALAPRRRPALELGA